MALSEKIKNLRLQMGYHETEFAKALGVTVAAVNHWEMGRRQPRIKMVRKMIELAQSHKIKITIKEFLEL